jgi:ubiquinone biosynthesis protein UbiJ
MTDDVAALWYVATTATAVSDRLKLAAAEGDVDVRDLADDVAWLARQVARLAERLAP